MSNNESELNRAEILERLAAARKRLGRDLVVLAHFYQDDDVVRFADFVGDSLQLGQKAAVQRDCRYIVFCAVSFMAEMARILALPEQEVLHPEPGARCPLAEMAGIDKVLAAWDALNGMGHTMIPVVYVNSNADLKAFCGRNGGLVCTSANADTVFRHVFSQGASVFFFPDENLGRNAARRVGVPDDSITLWDPERGANGTGGNGLTPPKVFLWKGHCYVHTDFLPADVQRVRELYPGISVIVHPECTQDVASIADAAGSTSFIKNAIEKSAPGSKWAVGTEFNFVDRLKRENPDKLVIPLKRSGCSDMAKVSPIKLLHVLEGLIDGELRGRVFVDADIVRDARTALERMLGLS